MKDKPDAGVAVAVVVLLGKVCAAAPVGDQLARVGAVQPAQNVEQRRFAAAALAQQKHQPARGKGQRHAAQRARLAPFFGAVCLCNASDLEHNFLPCHGLRRTLFRTFIITDVAALSMAGPSRICGNALKSVEWGRFCVCAGRKKEVFRRSMPRIVLLRAPAERHLSRSCILFCLSARTMSRIVLPRRAGTQGRAARRFDGKRQAFSKKGCGRAL